MATLLEAPPAKRDRPVKASAEEIHALEGAFEHFVSQTAQLQDAYRQLKKRAEQIDLELERKVDELDLISNFQRSILESIPNAVVVTDLNGTIRTFNSSAEAMWGIRREAAIGLNFIEVMGPHAPLLAGVLLGRHRRETVRREVGDSADGRRIISSSACLVEDSAGRPIGAVQVDQDITRVCALEAQLCQQEKLADLGKMAAGLAHEIRKPLNGIKGFASLLQRKTDGVQQRHAANIMEAADRLNTMLGRLLDFARPDVLSLLPCDLKAEAELVAEFVRAEDPSRPVAIQVEIADDVRMALADRDKIKQVLLNLVKNGVEAIEPGRAGRVTILACPAPASWRADGKAHVRVTVADSGKGIAPDKLGKIMEPFYSDKPGGTGLGLAIVKRILQLHGSELQIDSTPGSGTQVHFLLPACNGLTKDE